MTQGHAGIRNGHGSWRIEFNRPGTLNFEGASVR